MVRRLKIAAAALAGLLIASGPAAAQQIENELVLITPVAKTLTDPALAEFVEVREGDAGTSRSRRARSRPARRSPTAASSSGRAGPRPTSSGAARARSSTSSPSRSCWRSSTCRRRSWTRSRRASASPSRSRSRIPNGFWIGTVLEPYGLVYHPTAATSASGVPPPKDWDDLLHPKLKGNVAQCAPTRSSSSHATYEVILQRDGDDKGWEWLQRLGGNTGIFTARSRDVPSVVAKGEFAAGFAVPSYMAFEDRLAGFDIKFVAPKTAWITPEPIAILAGAKHPKAARAFIEYRALRARPARGDGAGRVPDHAEVPRAGGARLDGRDGGRVHRRPALLLRRRGDQHLRRRHRAEALRGGERAVPQGHRVGRRAS